jgi:glutaredoxin
MSPSIYKKRGKANKVADYTYLQTLLSYLTSRRTVPNVILDFTSIGGSDDLTLIHGEGGLQRTFQEMGMLPGWEWKAPSHVKKPEDEEARRLVDEIIQEEAEAGDL